MGVDLSKIVIQKKPVPIPEYHQTMNKEFAAKLRAGDSFEFEGENYKKLWNKGRNIRAYMRDRGLQLISRKLSDTKIGYWVVPLTKENDYED